MSAQQSSTGRTETMAALKAVVVGLLMLMPHANAQSSGSSYVGSKACSGCHTAIYRSFQKTGMGRSITLPAEWRPDQTPSNASVAQPGTARTFSVARDETGWKQSESEPGVFSVDHPLAYAIGSGENGLTFLVSRGQYLFQAPLSYYSRAKKWALSPGYEQVDLGFSRMVPEECINCHAGRAAILPNVPGGYARPAFRELAIGCENCHGPGEAHVKSAGKQAGATVNPAKLTPRLADNICINCHQTGDARVSQPGKTYLDFRPGQWLFDTAVIFKKAARQGEQQSDLLEHYSAMQASRCFRASAGKMSCLSCHDPHIQPRKEDAASYYRPKCLTCHTEQSCRLPLAVRAAQTPSDNCTGCHMPKRDVMQISHSALTNHRIPARADQAPPASKQDQQPGLVVVNPPDGKTAQVPPPVLLSAYKQVAQKAPEYQHLYFELLEELEKSTPGDKFVLAALGDRAFSQDRIEDAIRYFKLALPQNNSAIYLELGQSLAKLGRVSEAMEYLKKGVELDPYNAVMQKTLILQHINSKAYPEARLLMESYVERFPEDSLMRSLLARVGK